MYCRPIDGHYIRRNHVSALPHRFICMDSETKTVHKGNKDYHRLKIAWTVDVSYKKQHGVTSEKWKFWDSSYKLCKYLDEAPHRDEVLYLFGVNIYFDLQASDFFLYMTKWGWVRDFLFDKGSTYILVIRKGRKTIKILSTTNFWTSSARQLGQMVGYHKAAPDFATVKPGTLMCYCFRDTEIVLESIKKYLQFIDVNDLGSFRASRASQSYAAFRHRFMTHKIMHHDDDVVRELETAAYMGGRTEAFYIGELQNGPFVCYDVNSMYPYIMQNYGMPTQAIDYYAGLSRLDADDLSREYCVVSKVRVNTDEPVYAVKHDNKTVFPVGNFVCYLTTASLRYAIENCHVKRIYKIAIYKKEIIFDKYIDFFYAIRERAKQEGNPVWNKASKLFMNSLYGKFGQRRPIIELDEEIESDKYERNEIWDHETKTSYIETTMMNRRILQYGSEPCKGTVIAIPAHITDYARLLLWGIMRNVGLDSVLYCDTDSIFLRERDVQKIKHPIHQTTLGALSLKWRSNTLRLNGCKDYSTDSEIVLKGIPPKSPEIAPGIYSVMQWPKQSTHLHDRQNRFYVNRTVEKKARSEYSKGIVLPDGTVKPFTFPLSL